MTKEQFNSECNLIIKHLIEKGKQEEKEKAMYIVSYVLDGELYEDYCNDLAEGFRLFDEAVAMLAEQIVLQDFEGNVIVKLY